MSPPTSSPAVEFSSRYGSRGSLRVPSTSRPWLRVLRPATVRGGAHGDRRFLTCLAITLLPFPLPVFVGELATFGLAASSAVRPFGPVQPSIRFDHVK